jgi:ribosomal protein S18 acetylase RimI-like enzyme
VADVEIRPFRADDVGPAFAILAQEQRELGEPEASEGMFANAVAIADSAYAAEAGGELVGCADVRGGAINVLVRKPERRQGIGSALLREAEAATDASVLRLVAAAAQPAGAAFALANGYEKAWEAWLMGIELDDSLEPPRWPDDVAVRTFREEDAATVKELLDLAYAILNWNDGYVKDLVVHPERRRRGLGEGLMRHTFREFRRRGLDRVTLKTDSVNPTEAWRLYERLGMRKERTYEMFEKTVR